MRFGQASFEKRPRVDSGGRVTLEEDDVGVGTLVAPEEMIEGDLVERGSRRVGRNVAPDALLGLVRAHDHRGGVPADEALDSALEVRTSRHQDLVVGGNRVDIGGIGGERKLDAVFGGVKGQFTKKPRNFGGTAALQDII